MIIWLSRWEQKDPKDMILFERENVMLWTFCDTFKMIYGKHQSTQKSKASPSIYILGSYQYVTIRSRTESGTRCRCYP